MSRVQRPICPTASSVWASATANEKPTNSPRQGTGRQCGQPSGRVGRHRVEGRRHVLCFGIPCGDLARGRHRERGPGRGWLRRNECQRQRPSLARRSQRPRGALPARSRVRALLGLRHRWPAHAGRRGEVVCGPRRPGPADARLAGRRARPGRRDPARGVEQRSCRPGQRRNVAGRQRHLMPMSTSPAHHRLPGLAGAERAGRQRPAGVDVRLKTCRSVW